MLLMRDINSIEKKTVFATRCFGIASALALAIYLLLCFALSRELGDFSILHEAWVIATFGLGFGLVVVAIASVVVVCRHAALLSGAKLSTADVLLLVALSIPFFLSFVMAQRRVNALIDVTTASSRL
jgi:hypothetical protein